MKKLLEGSAAIAEMVRLARVQVISAYPITPQTHIVETLASKVANGSLPAQYVNAESEFTAASVILGASAVGARAYTATTSQGLLLMTEVLFNIAGLRLPVVVTCANRAVSAPINIWNDHQDAMTVRDAGWIQLYAEDNQESVDLHLRAFQLSEQLRLPVMVNVDGFILTHAFEPVELPSQADVDALLPERDRSQVLDPAHPLTLGPLAEPDSYQEARQELAEAVEGAAEQMELVAGDFERRFGRTSVALAGGYRLEDAETVIVALGSVNGTIKDTVDELRSAGHRVGSLKIVSFRPFPRALVRKRLGGAKHVVVIEKALSMGSGGILATEVRDALYGLSDPPQVSGYVAGLGGRDITMDHVKQMALAA
ncbi:MAG: pyruvate ferredoxin oxidoreductase, partial [Chloroflexota bacterium]|nr:pyruvate ferredoxin oxidoreductase [Chloroflexota bacterium]